MVKANNNILLVLGTFLIFTGIGIYWTYLGKALFINEQRFFMSELANSQASAIERRLSRSLSSTAILAQGVLEHRGPIPNFDDYASSVLNSVGGVSNLQLAPDGVVSFIYPLKGNEKALGHKIFDEDMRAKEAFLAVKTKVLTLAGPFEIIQGGMAVIGRAPVYLPTTEGEQFWGFASALIFLEDLLRVTELDALESKGYSYQLSRVHPDTGIEHVFAESGSALIGDRYIVNIKVPNGDWQLAMSRSKPVKNSRTVIGYLISVIVGCLFGWAALFFLEQPKKLRELVSEKTRELEYQANNDSLTGLYNRRFLTEQLNRIVKENMRYNYPTALMYMDLDNFKQVNDVMGHAAGDDLLRQVANRLQETVRINDIVTRLGGDEFGILLLNSDSINDVRGVAEKLIQMVEAPIYLNGKATYISLSIGVTMIPIDGNDNEKILKNADMAMYSAKSSGKRGVCFYNKKLHAKAVQKIELENELAAALNDNQFFLDYQPIISLSDGRVSGYEALIRWSHPRLGLLYPNDFIDLAEETGQVIGIGYWVIEEICNQINRLKLDCIDNLRFSINLSPVQFKDTRLVSYCREMFRKYNVNASSLEIEITESSVIRDPDATIKIILQLKKMGISISLDDFGTGYSSLYILKRLPVDKLKIDKSFIRELDQQSGDREIVEGVVLIAHKLGLEVVAEGVETDNQLDFVKGIRCDFGQGFLLGKPRPLKSLNYR